MPSQVALGSIPAGAEVKAKIIIGDALKDSRSEVASYSVSNEEILKVVFRPVDGKIGSGNIAFSQRYESEISVKALPSKKTIDERIKVLFKNGTQLDIPIYGGIILPFEFTPDRPTLYDLQPGQSLDLKMFLCYSKEEESSIQVLDAPKEVHVTIVPFDKTRKLVTLKVAAPAEPDQAITYRVEFAAGSGAVKTVVPIQLTTKKQ